MIDFKFLKEQHDCRIEVEKCLGEPKEKSGKSRTWNCPMHDDSSPSFTVYKDGFYCFGCGAHGDYLDWVCFWTKRPLSEVLRENKINLTPEEILRRKVESAEREIQAAKERIEKAETIIKEIKEGKLWEKYNEGLDSDDGKPRVMLEARGIPEWYQNYRYFGYDSMHNFGNIQSPTLTIPLFEPSTWECTNIRHRLLATEKGKYRPERDGLPLGLFHADPSKPLEGKVVVWEGEFKAAVLYVTDPDLNVIGLPGCNPSKELLNKFDKCDTIWLGLDPGANTAPIVKQLGRERVRIVDLPDKADDMIIQYELGRDWLRSNLRQARKA